MVFKRTTPAPDPQSPAIPPLGSNPQYAEHAAVRRALMDAKAARQARLDLLVVEDGIAQESVGPRKVMLAGRADALRKLAISASLKPPEPPAADDGMPADLAVALKLLSGESVEQPLDRDQRKRELRRELAILDAGWRAVEVLMADVRDAETARVAQSLQPEHEARLLAIYQAAAALAEAMQNERMLVSNFITSGYGDASHILRRPGLSAGTRLGSFDEHDSEISTFRRKLQDWGVL